MVHVYNIWSMYIWSMYIWSMYIWSMYTWSMYIWSMYIWSMLHCIYDKNLRIWSVGDQPRIFLFCFHKIRRNILIKYIRRPLGGVVSYAKHRTYPPFSLPLGDICFESRLPVRAQSKPPSKPNPSPIRACKWAQILGPDA